MNACLVRKPVIALSDFDHESKPARNELLEALSRDGFCFVESGGSSEVVHALLSELSAFFGSAGAQEKLRLEAYRTGLLRGYFPPLEPDGRQLERRKERLVFGTRDNIFPAAHPLLKHTYNELYAKHIKRIADIVYMSLRAYLEETDSQCAKNFEQFCLDPFSGELEPSVLSYAMHYPPLKNPEEFLNPDQTVTISEPHVDMTTFTILPRGTTGSTKMFDESGKAIPIYDTSVPLNAILVFVGKTLERLLEGIPFRNKNGSFPFKAFRHTVRNSPEEVSKDRDVVGYFFNGNSNRRYLSVLDGEPFGSMFVDRRPSYMKELEPLSGAELTVRDRQYLTEKLFFSDTSPNSASPPITLKRFRSVDEVHDVCSIAKCAVVLPS
jgi:isopenicillin N synthase-like dioxygenase